MIICDSSIRDLCLRQGTKAPLIGGYDEDQLNPISYDVTVGDSLMMEVSSGDGTPQFEKWDISKNTKLNPYLLQPKEFVLLHTEQTFNLPDEINHSLNAVFFLKSSRAREGYNHSFAGFCDPGWKGSTLTMEVFNNLRWGKLPIYPGLKLGQMVFFRTETPEKSYAVTGHYNHDKTVTPSVYSP